MIFQNLLRKKCQVKLKCRFMTWILLYTGQCAGCTMRTPFFAENTGSTLIDGDFRPSYTVLSARIKLRIFGQNAKMKVQPEN